MDFNALLRRAEAPLPIEPRELYEQLPKKAPRYGYLRDVQAQVLTKWHSRRDDRDIVLKVNTGGGKTIDGLVMLQSYLNEGISPALYVAPDHYLAEQVMAEAAKLGIETCSTPDDLKYVRGEAICVIVAAKLFNGRSVFGKWRAPSPVPIGAVVIDDAHAVIAILRSQLSVTLQRSEDKTSAFAQVLALFEDDVREQAPDGLLDIVENVGTGVVRVPFWAVRKKVDGLRAILRDHSEEPDLLFPWPGIKDVLELSRVVCTPSEITIVPPAPPVRQIISSFAEAQRRIFLTATLANDSVLVTDFDADPAMVLNPVQPLTAGDIGERMILAPQEINPAITADEIRRAVASLGANQNVLVLVPSNSAMARWAGLADVTADATNIHEIVTRMRSGESVGVVVMANKYDGVDLPQDACRVLVIDGLPEAFHGDDRLQSLLLQSTEGIDDRQVQRLEQGMGRAVRSNEDHCVVFLIGRRLSQLTADPRTLARFSPATRAQLEVSRTVASSMENTPLSKIMETAAQALSRDDGWVTYAKQALRKLEPAPARVDGSSVPWRTAFDLAAGGDLGAAANALTPAIETASDREAGRLLEQQAAYIDRYDPAHALEVLASARAKNSYVIRPLSGVTFRALSADGVQSQLMTQRLTSMYGSTTAMGLAVESIIERLTFDPTTPEDFEQAFFELGLFLGLGSQRPERELGSGPDNLWALDNSNFWVVEAKSGAVSEFIGKRDAAQLGAAQEWFRNRYAPGQASTPVMVHHSRKLYSDATVVTGMRILTERGIGEISASLRGLSEGLAESGWSDVSVVTRLLAGHKLDAASLHGYLSHPTGGSGAGAS